MEESLTLEELYLLFGAQSRAEHRHNKFMAALKGIDLDDSQSTADFDEVKMKADAALAGMSEEEFTFEQIGIEFESDDDE